MSGAHDAAVEALEAIYNELPVWMHPDDELFTEFKPQELHVLKFSNIRRVREALATLREHLGVDDD